MVSSKVPDFATLVAMEKKRLQIIFENSVSNKQTDSLV